MFLLLLTLHVLLAIFLVGPLAMVPMTALRSIRHNDAVAVRGAARQTTIFALASILVFALGFGVTSTKPSRFSLGDPWIVISMTLYVIALALVLFVLVPDLRRAGKIIEGGVAQAPKAAGDDAEAEPTVNATASDLAGVQRLGTVRGRVTGVAGLVSLLFIAIIVLMVTKPFD